MREVKTENKRLKSELETKEKYQSSFQSNNKAFIDKVQILNTEAAELKEQIFRLN